MQVNVAAVKQLRVMLVDDDDTVRDAITEILSRKGWRVFSFNKAEAAIEELRRDRAAYDVVVTDINMPGMDGIEFMHTVREDSPDIPVVMITGYPSIDVAVEAMKKGAADFLTKPFKSEELEIIIRKAVGEAKVVAIAGGEVKRPTARPLAHLPEIARQRIEEKIKELSILHTISETLDGVNERDAIFSKTMNLAQIIVDTERSFVMVVDHESHEAVVRASLGYDPSEMYGKRFSLADEPFKSVVASKSYTQAVCDKEELSLLVRGAADGNKSFLLAPILVNKKVEAMLGLVGGKNGGDPLQGEPPSSDDMMLLLNLTAKASLKLENIVLGEKIFANIIAAIKALINALDARDTYTKDHSNRVTRYAIDIAKAMNSKQDILDSIRFAGPLHDIGKIAVRDDILLKRGSFTAEENQLMMSHVVRGEEILRPLNLLESEKAVVLYHHERWDGLGYPNGFAGQEIPSVARIFSVADTFDAMTSTRPYRKALSRQTAKEEISKCSGSQFDPVVVEAFMECELMEE